MKLESTIERLKKIFESELVDAFEIFCIERKHLFVEAKEKNANLFAHSKETGVAIRVIKNKKMGWASSTDFSEGALAQLVKSAITSADEVTPSEEACFPHPYKEISESYNQLNEEKGMLLEEIPDEEKIEIAFTLEREALAADKRISRVRQPLYEEFIRRVIIYNSNGIERDYKRQMTTCEVKAIAEDKGASEVGWDFQFSPRFEDLNPKQVAATAAQRAVSLLGAGSLPSGKYAVVFDSRVAASLVRLAAPSFFAHNIQRKKSPLAGKKGQKIYDDCVTIIDDGLMPFGWGSFPFDDEGAPKQKNILVKNGVVIEWLYDQARAVKDKKASTGNSYRASVHDVPVININNCYLLPGKVSQDELLLRAESGLFISEVMGLHTANLVTGDFSLGAEGFLIRNGIRDSPVRGVIVAGNVHELFGNVKAIANDLRFIMNFGAPSIFVPDVQISGNS